MVEINDQEIIQFAINQFMGRKVNMNKWEEIWKVIDKIEEGGHKKTSLRRLDENESKEGGDRFVFVIVFNQHPKYIRKGYSREYCAIMAIGDFCKDLFIQEKLEKSKK